MLYFENATVVLTKAHGFVVRTHAMLAKASAVVDAILELKPSYRKARVINALLECSLEIEKGATLRDFYLALVPFKEELGDIFDIDFEPYIAASKKPYPLSEARRALLLEKCIDFSRNIKREYPPELTSFMDQLQYPNPIVKLSSYCKLENWYNMALLEQEPDSENWHLYSVPMSFSKVVDAELWLNTMTELSNLSDNFYDESLPDLLNAEAFGMLPEDPQVRNMALPVKTDEVSLRRVVRCIVQEIYYPDGSEEREAALMASIEQRVAAHKARRAEENEAEKALTDKVVTFPSGDAVEEELSDDSSSKPVKIEVVDGFIDQSVYDHMDALEAAENALLLNLKAHPDSRIVGTIATHKVSLLRKRDIVEPYEESVRVISP